MKSLKNRFNGNEQEVLDYARRFGIHRTMDKYGIKDYIAMRKWLAEKTGDENYGLNPIFRGISGSGDKTLLRQFVEQFADYVARKEAQLLQKETRIQELERLLGCYTHRELADIEQPLVAVLQACSQ